MSNDSISSLEQRAFDTAMELLGFGKTDKQYKRAATMIVGLVNEYVSAELDVVENMALEAMNNSVSTKKLYGQVAEYSLSKKVTT